MKRNKAVENKIIRTLMVLCVFCFAIFSLSVASKAQADAVCGVHNICNSQNQCVVANGSGSNQCQTDSDCATTHFECSNNQCITVTGVGINQCQANGDCSVSQHNACNAQKQCVLMGGAGANQCLTDGDCGVVALSSSPSANPPSSLSPSPLSGDMAAGIKNIIAFAKNPRVMATVQALSTAGIVVATAATASTAATTVFGSGLSLFEALLAPFGFSRKKKPWGVVYDSVTKRPIDPAYVVLTDIKTKKTFSSITDIDGRYGFLVKAGTYTITASKTNYSFPSKKLANKTEDELYGNLYFGATITVKQDEEVIMNNIPLDPLKFDWNEFAKKDKKLYKFYSHWDFILRELSDGVFIVGFILAIAGFFLAPHPYNIIILALYLLLSLCRIIGIRPKLLGRVTDKKTGEPLSFAIVRVVLPKLNIEVAHKVTDQYGRYYCLVPKGKYYVKIERKNGDGSYSLVYTSPVIDASKKGIIKEQFELS